MLFLLEIPLLTDLLNLVKEHGLVTVLIVVLGIVVWLWIKSILKSKKKSEEKMDVLYDLITDLQKDKIDEKTHMTEDKLSKYASNVNKVHELIYHLLRELDADRVSVFEYHNGGSNIKGINFNKCTNTYEAIDLGIERKSKDYQALPISTNILWTSLLYDKKPIIINNIEYIKDNDKSLYILLTSQNIKSYYSMIINDYDGSPIGFIEIVNYTKVKNLNADEFKMFNDTAINIAGLINKKL